MSNLTRRMTLEDLILQEAVRPVARDQLEAGWIPELPMPVERYLDLESRMPEADFVPEAVQDERLRRHFRAAIRTRQHEAIQRRRRSNQWGATVSGLLSGQQGSLLRWQAEDDDPLAVNLQLGYTTDASIVTPTFIPGPNIIVNKSAGVVALPTDDVNLYARVDWGSGGVASTAFADVQYGTQLRLTATFVNVAVYYNRALQTPWPDPTQYINPVMAFGADVSVGPLSGPPVTVTSQIGRGHPQLNVSAARFTRKFGILQPFGPGPLPAPGAAVLFDLIPPYASAFGVSFVDSNPAAGGFSVSFAITGTNTTPASAATSTVFTLTDTTPTEDFEHLIPLGGRFMSVQNNTQRQIVVNLVYSLMMG